MKTRWVAGMLALVLMAVCIIPVTAMATVELEPIIATDGEEYDAFGQAVGIGEFEGSYTAFVGAPGVDGNSGVVYLLGRDIDGWVEQSMIHPDVSTGPDRFGASIDLDSDYLIVGAPDAQKSLNQLTGLAYVFLRNASGAWVQKTILAGTDIAPSDQFGVAVAVSGNRFVVGAPYADTTQDDAGAAYLFENSDGVWTQKKLVPETPVAFAFFGSSVGITGDWVLVGAPWENTTAGIGAGVVYVFKKNGSQWNQIAKWKAPGSDLKSYHFGESIDAYGDYAVIGGTGGGRTNGSAYIYKKENDVWSLAQTLSSDSPYDLDQFGISVSISSSKLLVGSVAMDDHTGAVHLYQFSGTTWNSKDSYVANPDFSNNGDYFGKAVAVSEEFLIVGADGYDEPGQNIPNVGAVFVDQSGDVANLTPVISPISDIYRNGTTVFTVPFTIADANDTTLTVLSATSDNQDVLPDANLTLTAGAMPYLATLDAENKKDLSLQILPVGFGSANITITVQDSGGKEARETFSLIVTHPPVFSLQDPEVEIEEDEVHSFTIEFSDEDGDPLKISVASDNPGLVPTGGLLLNGGSSPLDVTLDPDTNNVMVTLTIDPVDNANSGTALDNTAEITVTVTDGSTPVVKAFTLIIAPVNDPPTVSAIDNVSIPEDSEKTITFNVGDIDSNVSDPGFKVTATSNNASLIPNENLVVGGAGETRTLTITPLPDANSDIEGTAVITVNAQDDKGEETTRNFTLTVTAVDDLPSFIPDPLLDAETVEDTPFVYSFSVYHGDEESLTVTVTSDNQSILPDENILINGNASPRTIIMPGKNAVVDLELTPVSNETGSLIILVQVEDESGNMVDDTFKLTVNDVNDPPTISDVDDITIPEDSDTEIEVTFDDSDDLITTLTLEYESSNPGLLPLANIVAIGTGGTRTITLTPLPDKHGTTDVTIRVKDPQGASDQTKFKLTVTSVNDDPVITIDEGPYTVNEDQVFGPLAFTVTDVDGDALTVTASSQAQAVVATSGISIIGIGSNRQVTVTPEADASGQVGIELTVSDGNGGSDIGYFLLNVEPVNDPPEISGLNNFYRIDEDTQLPDTGFLSFSITDVDGDTMLLTGESDNDTLVPDANVQLGGTGNSRTLRVVPFANKSGTANITLTVDDQQGEANSTKTFSFELEVVEINDLPTISNVAFSGFIQEVIDEDAEAPFKSSVLTDPLMIEICDVDATYLVVTLSSDDDALLPQSGLDILYDTAEDGFTLADNKNHIFAFSKTNDLDANGCNKFPVDIWITPGLYENGTGNVTVTVEDNTGAVTDTDILIVVNEVDSPPTIEGNPDTDAIVGEPYEFTPTASDPEGEQLTFTIAYEDDAGMAQTLPDWLNFDTATGTLSGTPMDSDQGNTENIIINVEDPSGQAADPPLKFKITVTREEAKPLINDGAGITTPQTVDEMMPGDDEREIAFTVSDANGDSLDLSVAVAVATSIGDPSSDLIEALSIVDATDGTEYFNAGVDIVDPTDDVVVPLDTDLGVPVNLKLLLKLVDYANRDQYGTVKLTVSIDDGYPWNPPLTWKPFTLVVNPVSSAAVLLTVDGEPLMNQTFSTLENTTETFSFLVRDPDGGILTLEAVSSNSELLPDSNIDIGGIGFGNSYTFSASSEVDNPMTMRLKPEPNVASTSRITLTLTGEGRPTSTAVVVYNVGAVNDAPTIDAPLTTWNMDEGTEKTFTFNLEDTDGDDLDLTINYPEDHMDLRVNDNVYASGAILSLTSSVYANSIQVTVIPEPDFNTVENDPSGPVTITATVTDNQPEPSPSSDTQNFLLYVEPSNDPPTIDQLIDPQTTDEDVIFDVPLLMSDPDGDTLEVEFESSNADLISADNIMLMVDGAERFPRLVTATEYQDPDTSIIIQLNPETDANTDLFGSAIVTVRVKDVTTSAETSFRVYVNPVEDDPEITEELTDRLIDEDDELTFTFMVADADADTLTVRIRSELPGVLPNDKLNIFMDGDAALVGDTLEGKDDLDRNVVLATVKTRFGQPTPINLTLKPLANQSSDDSFVVHIDISDGRMAGDPLSPVFFENSFKLTVEPINDPPVISGLFNTYTMTKDTPYDINFTVTDIDSNLNIMQVFKDSSDPDLIPNNITYLNLSGPTIDPQDSTKASYTLTVLNDPSTDITPNSASNITLTFIDDKQAEAEQTFEMRVVEDSALIPVIWFEGGGIVDMYDDETATFEFFVRYDPPPLPGDANFKVFAFSSNTDVFPDGTLTPEFMSPETGQASYDHKYRLVLTPKPNSSLQKVDVTISLRANVNGYVGENSELTVRVIPRNDPPTIELNFGDTVNTLANAPKTVTFTVSDPETEARNLDVKVSYSLSAGVITSHELVCTDGNCQLTLNPIASTSETKSTNVTISVDDGDVAEPVEDSFLFRVFRNNGPIVIVPETQYHIDGFVGDTNGKFFVDFTVSDTLPGTLELSVSATQQNLIESISVKDDNGDEVVGAMDSIGTIVLQEGALTMNMRLEITPIVGALGEVSFSIRAENAGQEDGIGEFDVVISIPGDIDNSRAIDLADAIMALKILSGTNVAGVNLWADLDPFAVNKRIGMEEVIYILQYVAMLR